MNIIWPLHFKKAQLILFRRPSFVLDEGHHPNLDHTHGHGTVFDNKVYLGLLPKCQLAFVVDAWLPRSFPKWAKCPANQLDQLVAGSYTGKSCEILSLDSLVRMKFTPDFDSDFRYRRKCSLASVLFAVLCLSYSDKGEKEKSIE